MPAAGRVMVSAFGSYYFSYIFLILFNCYVIYVIVIVKQCSTSLMNWAEKYGTFYLTI